MAFRAGLLYAAAGLQHFELACGETGVPCWPHLSLLHRGVHQLEAEGTGCCERHLHTRTRCMWVSMRVSSAWKSGCVLGAGGSQQIRPVDSICWCVGALRADGMETVINVPTRYPESTAVSIFAVDPPQLPRYGHLRHLLGHPWCPPCATRLLATQSWSQAHASSKGREAEGTRPSSCSCQSLNRKKAASVPLLALDARVVVH